MRYSESLLRPGDRLHAIGPSSRVPTPNGRTLLLMQAMGLEEHELILTNKSEEQLVSKLRTPFIVGLVVVIVGAAMLVAGPSSGSSSTPDRASRHGRSAIVHEMKASRDDAVAARAALEYRLAHVGEVQEPRRSPRASRRAVLRA